jgi:hypothetical protein
MRSKGSVNIFRPLGVVPRATAWQQHIPNVTPYAIFFSFTILYLVETFHLAKRVRFISNGFVKWTPELLNSGINVTRI